MLLVVVEVEVVAIGSISKWKYNRREKDTEGIDIQRQTHKYTAVFCWWLGGKTDQQINVYNEYKYKFEGRYGVGG